MSAVITLQESNTKCQTITFIINSTAMTTHWLHQLCTVGVDKFMKICPGRYLQFTISKHEVEQENTNRDLSTAILSFSPQGWEEETRVAGEWLLTKYATIYLYIPLSMEVLQKQNLQESFVKIEHTKTT
jgi:hypothetical protein